MNFCTDLRLKRCGELETSTEVCSMEASSFTKGKSVLQELLMERDGWILERVCQ